MVGVGTEHVGGGERHGVDVLGLAVVPVAADSVGLGQAKAARTTLPTWRRRYRGTRVWPGVTGLRTRTRSPPRNRPAHVGIAGDGRARRRRSPALSRSPCSAAICSMAHSQRS